MPKLEDEILETFYSALAESGEIDGLTLDKLRDLFNDGNVPKADDLVAAFSARKRTA